MATGKIARFPRHIRNKLSQRLDDGEGGDSLLEWLNGLPEVKKRERWEEAQGRRGQEQREKNLAKAKRQATGALWAQLLQGPLAQALGGGEKGSKIAELMSAIENDLPLPPSTAPEPDGQTQSGPVKDSRG